MEIIGLLALGALVFLLASVAQAVTGFGSALVSVPLLIPVVGPVQAVVAGVLVSTALCAHACVKERGEIDLGLVKRTSAAAILGLPLGLVLLTVLPEVQLSLLVAGVVVVCALALALVKLPPVGRLGQAAGGFISGTLTTSTGLNGPPLVITYQAAGLEPRRFRATLQASFLVQDVFAIVGFVLVAKIDATACFIALGGLAGVPAGWAIGDRVFRGLNPETFRRLVLAGLVATAAGSVATTIH
ncbi:sulfite exporter TauE/SafE family protein [Nocardioides alcanivorans]|uniref:sulfite exporter TauE/SafE family protein n=1 Tax=Nocardioides alcanivorans TaxID=2897352 RepID=UPI001F2FD662|nr:sulfite exporter TauE/SafE family protein [Nocardioides alcanivorans]